MSHYAEIDKNNIVLRVVVGNPELSDEDGLAFITNLLDGRWVQTSYNATIRGNFAGIGYSYLETEDIFMPPKCHSEATLDAKAAKWVCTNKEHDVTFG